MAQCGVFVSVQCIWKKLIKTWRQVNSSFDGLIDRITDGVFSCVRVCTIKLPADSWLAKRKGHREIRVNKVIL